ncbi:hypothetical protein ACQUQU_15315 [Thalassolituus sp. LLYu03]|uniref:hypothetical protein n=1 Tax=Thalassolituus sp. LLYu03 TaxID=3421656 RepID=UPI003D2887AA
MRGLSRSNLNVIIFICMGAIIWINLNHNRQEDVVLEPLKIPALNDGGWSRWSNQEQVSVLLRAGGTTEGGVLVVRSASGSQHIRLPASDWAPPLREQLANLPAQTPAVVLISGPWSATDQQAMAALIIRERQLQPLSASVEHWPSCIASHLPGALWLGEYVGVTWQSLNELPAMLGKTTIPDVPGREEWAIWRLDQSRQLRRAWQDEQSQIDIQADLTYHRLPDSAYQSLYLSLADAQKTEVTEALDCLLPAQVSAHE